MHTLVNMAKPRATEIIRRTLSLLIILFGLWSCSDDDEGYTPLNINTVSDQAEVFQNAVLTLDILENDTNVPIDGQILLDSPSQRNRQYHCTQQPRRGTIDLYPKSWGLGRRQFYLQCL